MAVLLCRSDGKPFPVPPPPELKGFPKIVVDYQPPPDLSGKGKVVTARSSLHYAHTSGEPREKLRRDAYERHQEQLTQCGFRSSISKPYRDMGEVIMDDSKLILEGLGQSGVMKEVYDVALPNRLALSSRDKPPAQQPASMNSPYMVKLRSKIPSQFPVEMRSLDHKISKGSTQLESMRRGKDLPRILKTEREEKESQEKMLAQQNIDAFKNQWREAEVMSEFIETEDGHLVRQDPLSCDQSVGHLSCDQSKSSDQLDAEKSNSSPIYREPDDDGGLNGEKIIYHWYRRLCVLVWIMEAMQLESLNYATPFSKCWEINCPRVSMIMNEDKSKRLYEKRKTRLAEWNKLVKGKKNVDNLHAKMFSLIAFRKSPLMKRAHDARKKMAEESLPEIGAYRKLNMFEEIEIRKQKKLTPAQMDDLITMLDEELNYSQKVSRKRINALIKENSAERRKNMVDTSTEKAWQFPPVSLDMSALEREFLDGEEEKKMIVHEQLTSMEREREKSIHQRFESFHISGNIHNDLANMRQGVETETTETAKRKLLMSYHWYEELLSLLPREVRNNRYCQQLLESLYEAADYLYKNGPEKNISKDRLMEVLAFLEPWELEVPDIEAAVMFLIERVIYIAKEDYSKWLEQHRLKENFKRTKNISL